MRKNYVLIYISISLSVILLFCTGCQKTPEINPVISKNDGLFDAESAVPADKSYIADDLQDVSFHKIFTSTDGSVTFNLDINQSVIASNMPIVQVEPHFLTIEDAKRVALTFFPNAVFYEAEPARSENFSKSEIQAKLNRWSQYTNQDALKTLYGDDSAGDSVEVIKSFIERYTQMYESAPENNPHTPCKWKMRKTSEYLVPEDELVEFDLSNDNDEISIQFSVNEIPYYFTVATRNKSDFKVNIISCYLYSGISPNNIDERIFNAKLCRTSEPTQAEIDTVKASAEELLSAMNFGQWQIDECYVSSEIFGNQTEYSININAVPVLNGIPALRRPQLAGLRNKDGYAPSQYLTDANFRFSPKGELLSFTLYTPVEIQEIVNDNVKVMSMDSLLTQAQERFMLTDAYAYGFGDFLQFSNEEVQCNVTVSAIEYGLSRVKVPDSDDSYYYVPSMLFQGSSEYIGKSTGKTYYVSEKPEVLMVINAVDGTVINATNE